MSTYAPKHSAPYLPLT